MDDLQRRVVERLAGDDVPAMRACPPRLTNGAGSGLGFGAHILPTTEAPLEWLQAAIRYGTGQPVFGGGDSPPPKEAKVRLALKASSTSSDDPARP
jgi:hypothetical protein